MASGRSARQSRIAAAALRQAVRNNGGGHANHSLFWQVMSPKGVVCRRALAAAIDRDLGGFENFKTEFTKAAISRFGSGWAWLGVDPAASCMWKAAPIRTTL
jgi:superoxide dismutase